MTGVPGFNADEFVKDFVHRFLRVLGRPCTPENSTRSSCNLPVEVSSLNRGGMMGYCRFPSSLGPAADADLAIDFRLFGDTQPR